MVFSFYFLKNFKVKNGMAAGICNADQAASPSTGNNAKAASSSTGNGDLAGPYATALELPSGDLHPFII